MKLLGKALPVVIQTEAEYLQLLDATRELMEKEEEDLTQEETRLLELLGVLVEEYEDRVSRFRIPRSGPGPVTRFSNPRRASARFQKSRADALRKLKLAPHQGY